MKKTILILATVSLSILSCSEDDAPAKNEAPNSFEITVTAKALNSGTIISAKSSKVSPIVEQQYKYEVTWTDAVDPEGDAVTYDVEIGGDQIVEGTTTKSAVINESDLVDGSKQTVKVIATDSKGAPTIVNEDFARAISKLELPKG